MVEQIVALLDVLAFGRRRLGFQHRMDQAGRIFDQLVAAKLILPTGA